MNAMALASFSITALLAASGAPRLSMPDHGLPLYTVGTLSVIGNPSHQDQILLWTSQPFAVVSAWYENHLPGFRRENDSKYPHAVAFERTTDGEVHVAAVYQMGVLIRVRVSKPRPLVSFDGSLDARDFNAAVAIKNIPPAAVQPFVYPGARETGVEHCSFDCRGFAAFTDLSDVETWYAQHLPAGSDEGTEWRSEQGVQTAYHFYDMDSAGLRYRITLQHAPGTFISLAYGKPQTTVRFLQIPPLTDVTACTAHSERLGLPLYPGSVVNGLGGSTSGSTTHLMYELTTADMYQTVKDWYVARLPKNTVIHPSTMDYGPNSAEWKWGDRLVRVRGGYTRIELSDEYRIRSAQGILFGSTGGYVSTSRVSASRLHLPIYGNIPVRIEQKHMGDDPQVVYTTTASIETLDSFETVLDWYRSHLPAGSLRSVGGNSAIKRASFMLDERDGLELKAVDVTSTTRTSIDAEAPCPALPPNSG